MRDRLVGLLAFSLCIGLACRVLAEPGLVERSGPFQSDQLRHPAARAHVRTGTDLLAIPASVVGWDALDWVRFGVYGVLPLGLMIPDENSLDLRLQREVVRPRQSHAADVALVHMKTIPISIGLAGYGAILFGTNLFFGNDQVFEMGSLQVEALGATQFFHVTTKLLLGREGPYQGPGRVHGPTRLFFPGGTPSGHAATLYAVLTVAGEYWGTWWTRALAHAGGIYVSTSLVYHNQHFLSDVIWGAAMGHFIGRFVVKHRSSRFRYASDSLGGLWERSLVVPVATREGGALMLSGSF